MMPPDAGSAAAVVDDGEVAAGDGTSGCLLLVGDSWGLGLRDAAWLGLRGDMLAGSGKLGCLQGIDVLGSTGSKPDVMA